MSVDAYDDDPISVSVGEHSNCCLHVRLHDIGESLCVFVSGKGLANNNAGFRLHLEFV